MLVPGPDLHRVGPLERWDFRNIFMPNTDEDQKKSYISEGPLALCHIVTLKKKFRSQLFEFREKLKKLSYLLVK